MHMGTTRPQSQPLVANSIMPEACWRTVPCRVPSKPRKAMARCLPVSRLQQLCICGYRAHLGHAGGARPRRVSRKPGGSRGQVHEQVCLLPGLLGALRALPGIGGTSVETCGTSGGICGTSGGPAGSSPCVWLRQRPCPWTPGMAGCWLREAGWHCAVLPPPALQANDEINTAPLGVSQVVTTA